jgi:hypothetical protein
MQDRVATVALVTKHARECRSPEPDWECPHCTYINGPASLSCDTCDMRRPRQTAAAVAHPPIARRGLFPSFRHMFNLMKFAEENGRAGIVAQAAALPFSRSRSQ